MLTRLRVRNFKRLHEVDIELGNLVVFVGPNNSGKTSALQALALWDIGVKRWLERRGNRATPAKRPGVTISRRDLIAMPVPDADLLWRGTRVRDVQRANGKPHTRNILIDIAVEGVTAGAAWSCGMEFDYANPESFYCRPLSSTDAQPAPNSSPPAQAVDVSLAYLPPMSGLAANEVRLDQGAVNVRIGEGRTAEVLRNLCYQVQQSAPERWQSIAVRMERLFSVRLRDPVYLPERGEVELGFEENGALLDLSCAGRGLQQTLLLLAYMHGNPGSTLLLDEPDAHLEVLRQRQIYQELTDVAAENGNQIIAASHSEVILDEAAERDVVVAFIGRPHRINDRGSQLRKALRDICLQDYYLAEQAGWVLYLEGSTDLAILRALARRLGHRAAAVLERTFVQYVGNDVARVARHYHGLREASPNLRAVAVFDRLERELPPGLDDIGLVWRRREIENYLTTRATLISYARQTAAENAEGPLFATSETDRHCEAMVAGMEEVAAALATLGKGDPWGKDTKVSDDFLTPLFAAYFRRVGLPNAMAKTNFHTLAECVPLEEIDAEVSEKLDAILAVAEMARTP